MSYSSRRWVIFNVSEISTIDFNDVLEFSQDTVRKSRDNTLVLVKYDGSMPSSVSSLTTKSQEYTYDEILPILATNVWNYTP